MSGAKGKVLSILVFGIKGSQTLLFTQFNSAIIQCFLLSMEPKMRILLLIPFLLSSLAMASGSYKPKAVKKQEIASGKVTLPANLKQKAKGIRTLYISLYDPASKRPMPYGAQRLMLKSDAGENVVSFKLNTETMQLMGGGPIPKKFKLKAKLDADGSAGPDAKGDITGFAENVALGSKNVTIKLTKAH